MKGINRIILAALSVSVISCSGCSLTGNVNNEDTESETTVTSDTERYIMTTRTAQRGVDNYNNDEDINGYTTTQDTETGTLENPIPDEPDPDILATTTTTLYTTTTTKETAKKKAAAKAGKKTSKKQTAKKTTAETKFTKDKLYKPLDREKFKSKVKYKITSDTTYLNLRFGPSKKYDVQLKIPDGKYINGTARTKDDLGNYWIYVSYKGTIGWVMEELLTKQ